MKNNNAYGSLASFLPFEEALFPFDQEKIFGRSAPLEAEIGFGTGEYITRLGADMPERDLIGFEQCARRIVRTLRKVHELKLSNVRLMRVDVFWAMRYLLAPRSLAKVHCLFPCPWPKKRHAKNRLFNTAFLRLLNSRLADGALLYIVTDHKPYAEWIAEQLPGSGFTMSMNIIPAKFGTKFERKWAEAGQSEFFELTLVKTQHQNMPEGGRPVKTYFIEEADLSKVVPEDVWGPLTVKFGSFVYDPRIEKAVVDAVVSEDGRAQHLWLIVIKTPKGWCVCPAGGTVVLPTEGAQQAIDRLAAAVEASGK